jgi:hypothetical protein
MAETKQLGASDVELPDGFDAVDTEIDEIGEDVVSYLVVEADQTYAVHATDMAGNRVLIEEDTFFIGKVDAEQELSQQEAQMAQMQGQIAPEDLEEQDDGTFLFTMDEAGVFFTSDEGAPTEGVLSEEGGTIQGVLDSLAERLADAEEETLTVA